jgi:hypothetical protein
MLAGDTHRSSTPIMMRLRYRVISDAAYGHYLLLGPDPNRCRPVEVPCRVENACRAVFAESCDSFARLPEQHFGGVLEPSAYCTLRSLSNTPRRRKYLAIRCRAFSQLDLAPRPAFDRLQNHLALLLMPHRSRKRR